MEPVTIEALAIVLLVALSAVFSGMETALLSLSEVKLRARADEAPLPRMLQALDDPFLVNRQFASRSLESWLGLSLADIGHRFHTSSEQRQPGIR